ncbi:lambda exonuclease family protein [Riemerella anatipestifer]|uniref:lambda exonuclease family protein n=1 Tax=Riemerella anatipestifer TaxID=34085 RepID=UPI001BDB2330|nr:lambda exonuclease family protein [Riemerella anatipestifer]MBT0554293.1 YqaJ viral recombinase family protein [Riemerella anatipestifer]MCE3024970.1 YqaJ viral recombinase family protein [Riemerella anatipestifer]MDY3449842.1 YqaJ viral recombinase family protein [Riemerella anatipestifer]QYR03340.1 YqaJ viral recombinase family protein [Riemerella anatipestifer]QYR05609.1 YqaJ viral recombinase family protein [Riemerella anatipestifer]
MNLNLSETEEKEIQTLDFESLENLKTSENISSNLKEEQWLAQRRGKFTSSQVYRLMTCLEKDELPKGAITYIEEVIVDELTEGKGAERFKSEDMQRGNDTELEAITRFEKETRLKVYATGEEQEFVELCNYFGGTPDGIIDNDCLIEVKCPKSKTHLFYLKNLKTQEDLKKHCTNYYWQIQGNLLATGRSKAFFISYDDRFTKSEHQILILEIERNDEDIELLKKRLQLAERTKKLII